MGLGFLIGIGFGELVMEIKNGSPVEVVMMSKQILSLRGIASVTSTTCLGLPDFQGLANIESLKKNQNCLDNQNNG